jgi:hypothetical protein
MINHNIEIMVTENGTLKQEITALRTSLTEEREHAGACTYKK